MIILLINAIEDGSDRDFLLEVYEKYSGLIRGTAFEIVQNEHDMNDIEQTVVVKLIDKIETLKALDKYCLISYIQKTAKNASYDLLRKTKRERCVNSSEMEDEKTSEQTDFTETLFSTDAVESAMHKISAGNREVLSDKFFLDMTDYELAKKYGIKISGVRMKISRAKKELKKYLEEVGE